MSFKNKLVCAGIVAATLCWPQNSQDFFDAKTLNGWEVHGPASWSARNGALTCDGSAPSWIGTLATFNDYALTLEFRGNEKVNSGVFLRSQKEGQPHITGYELQIWDYQPAGFNTGSLVGSAKAEATRILPDAWNKCEVTAQGDHFVVVLNGKKLLDVHDAKHTSGVIGLQCQKDNVIGFRNLSVRELR